MRTHPKPVKVKLKNSNSAVSVFLTSAKKDFSKIFGLLSFTTDISTNPKVNLFLELDKKELPKIELIIGIGKFYFNQKGN